jgi:hypothetical protein
VSAQAIFPLVVATLVPIAPLLLTMIPLNELLKKLFGIVFWAPRRRRRRPSH